jgi:hypothetical protein
LEDFCSHGARPALGSEVKQSRRVKVSFERLRLWYETLDELLAEKPRVGGHLATVAQSV